MHARELVEVAGLVALHGPQFIRGELAVGPACLEQYWAASKTRFDSWCRALKSQTGPASQGRETRDAWVDARASLDEIFASELLTRVWTAVVVARDRRTGQDQAEPLARNVLATHTEARGRALQLLMHGSGVSTAQAVALNRLRRRVERWCDVLLGGLLHEFDAREFAFEPARAEDFAADLARQRNDPAGRNAWRLLLVSLRNAFQSGLSPLCANPEANARIASAVLGSFHEELFDSTGLFKSLWMMRMTATASDAQGMISELLAPATPPPALRRSRPGGRRI